MAKKGGGTKRSLIGGVGATLIGAAILFFIITIVLGQLQTVDYGQTSDAWNDSNDTISTLLTFTTICVILLGVMGITMVGASILAYITGAFQQTCNMGERVFTLHKQHLGDISDKDKKSKTSC